MYQILLKAVGSSHKYAPDTLQPMCALSGPTSQRSQVSELALPRATPFVM